MTTTTEEPMTAGDAPAQGQLVTVRNRVWVVSDVVKSTLAPQPRSVTGRPTHVVTLVSIEDDARDEQLRVSGSLSVAPLPTTSTPSRIQPTVSTISDSTHLPTPPHGYLTGRMHCQDFTGMICADYGPPFRGMTSGGS